MWLAVADLEFRASVRFIKNGEVEEAMMRRVAVDTQQGALRRPFGNQRHRENTM